MKITKAKKQIVYDLVDEWTKKLFLHQWELEVIFKEEAGNNPDALAYVNPNHIYRKARLVIYPDLFTCNKQQIKEAIIHELIHCVTEELPALLFTMNKGTMVTDSEIEDATETVIQQLARAIAQL